MQRGVLRRPVVRGGDAVRTFETDLAPVIAAAEPHECDARGYTPQPGAEPTALLVATKRLGQSDEDIVDDVLGVLPGANQAVGEAVQTGAKCVVQRSQSFGVTSRARPTRSADSESAGDVAWVAMRYEANALDRPNVTSPPGRHMPGFTLPIVFRAQVVYYQGFMHLAAE